MCTEGRGGKGGEKRGGEEGNIWGWGGTRGQGPLSLSFPALKKREGEATNEVKGIEFKQFSLGKGEGDPQSATLSLFSFISFSLLCLTSLPSFLLSPL